METGLRVESGGVIMRAKNFIKAAVLLIIGLPSSVVAAPVPRPSPDLTIMDASGGETALSSLKGKVVLVEFLLVKCASCVLVAQTINRLYGDLAPQGFQAIGVAFDTGLSARTVSDFTRLFKLTYPVGYTSSDRVDSYLGRTGAERFQVPQIVVIDQAGVIRAQSRPIGETDLADEKYLRNMVGELLKNGAASGKTGGKESVPDGG
jgi:peroxiredoxin